MSYTPRFVPFVLYSLNPILSLRNLETGVFKTENRGCLRACLVTGRVLKLLIMEHVSWEFLDKFTNKVNTNIQDTVLA